MTSSQPQRRTSRAHFQHQVWDAPLQLEAAQVPAGMRLVRRGATSVLQLQRRTLRETVLALPSSVLFAMRWVRDARAGLYAVTAGESAEALAARPPRERLALAQGWLRTIDPLAGWDDAMFTALVGGLGGQIWKTPEGRHWAARAGSPQGIGIEARGTKRSMNAFFRRLDWSTAVRLVRADPEADPAWLAFAAQVLVTRWEAAASLRASSVPTGGRPARKRATPLSELPYSGAFLRGEWGEWTMEQALPLLAHPRLPREAWTSLFESVANATVAVTVADAPATMSSDEPLPLLRGAAAWHALMTHAPARAIAVLQAAPHRAWTDELTPRDFKPLLTSVDREVRLAGARLASQIAPPRRAPAEAEPMPRGHDVVSGDGWRAGEAVGQEGRDRAGSPIDVAQASRRVQPSELPARVGTSRRSR